VLSLSSNNISCPASLTSLRSLKELHLSDNTIRTIPMDAVNGEFPTSPIHSCHPPSTTRTHSSQQWVLYFPIQGSMWGIMWRCRFLAYEVFLAGLPLLTRLKLDNNRLHNLEGLSCLPALEELHVSGNRLCRYKSLCFLEDKTVLTMAPLHTCPVRGVLLTSDCCLCRSIDMQQLPLLTALTNLEMSDNPITRQPVRPRLREHAIMQRHVQAASLCMCRSHCSKMPQPCWDTPETQPASFGTGPSALPGLAVPQPGTPERAESD